MDMYHVDGKMDIELSIIIPVYNAKDFLDNCLSSLRYSNTDFLYEIICIDDGSSDGSGILLDEYAEHDERIKVFHTENQGVSSARNLGMNYSRGKFISFVDADDEVCFKGIMRMLSIAQTEEYDIVVGEVMGDESSTNEAQTLTIEMLEGAQALKKSIEDHEAFYSACGKIYKKTFIEGISFVKGKRIHEDSFFCFQCCCRQPKVALTNIPVYRYMVRENSASRADFSEKFFDIRYFCELKCEIIQRDFPQLQPLLANLRIKASLALLHCLLKSKGKQYRQDEKREIAIVIRERKYFNPAIKGDKIWFFIVRFRLYFIYKTYKNIKNTIRGFLCVNKAH